MQPPIDMWTCSREEERECCANFKRTMLPTPVQFCAHTQLASFSAKHGRDSCELSQLTSCLLSAHTNGIKEIIWLFLHFPNLIGLNRRNHDSKKSNFIQFVYNRKNVSTNFFSSDCDGFWIAHWISFQHLLNAVAINVWPLHHSVIFLAAWIELLCTFFS